MVFDRISVWLDERTPDDGPFAHALEWAARLDLPLHGVVIPAGSNPAVGAKGGDEARTLQVCAERCKGRKVAWDGAVWQGAPELCVNDFLNEGALCVYGQSLPPAQRDELLFWSLRGQSPASLVCPSTWSPLSRVLLLNQGKAPGSSFLSAAAGVCRRFHTVPVVLTVARSESDARSYQRLAQDTFAAQHLLGDFDFVVGCDVRAAVVLEAQWRRCSHVFMERRTAPPWWRWLRGEPLKRLLGLSDVLTFFSLGDIGSRRPAAEPEPKSSDRRLESSFTSRTS
jgi:hypothetical protein